MMIIAMKNLQADVWKCGTFYILKMLSFHMNDITGTEST